MTSRLRLIALYFVYWVALFAGARVLFLLYQHGHLAGLGLGTIGGIFVHGLRMDVAAAAYLTLLPLLALAFLAFAPPAAVRWTLRIYTGAVLALVALLTTVDLGLFDAWGFRLDATPLQYLGTPHEMMASVESSPLVRLAAILVIFLVVAVAAYRAVVDRRAATLDRGGWLAAVVLLALAPFFLVPMRGGVQWTPLNQSSVYFSSSEFANQAALNVGWNFFHSITTKRALARTNPYTEIGAAEARAVLDSVLHESDPRAAPSLLRIRRPNVILIIWESFTAKVVERLGGVAGVTPHFDSLTHEGVFFDQLYASGDRSAKGLVAILSGFPAAPDLQIMNTPKKAATLPMLSRDFGAAGYSTAFYYGGELEFANIKSYLLNGRFGQLVGESAFDPRDRNSKWGAHDHVVLGKLLHDIPGARRPFFTTLFTLSSHEPFEVPMAPVFPGTDTRSEFLNAHAYTDRSIGAFIRSAEREPWWDSTLVIIIADHGHPLPRLTPSGDTPVATLYHIPMLWLGGALAVRDTVIHRIGSQTDLAPTLLAEVGLPAEGYRWGRDLLAPDAASFAYFSYHDGFGVVDPRGVVVYDHLAHRVTQQAGSAGEAELRSGLAYLRLCFQDYLDR